MGKPPGSGSVDANACQVQYILNPSTNNGCLEWSFIITNSGSYDCTYRSELITDVPTGTCMGMWQHWSFVKKGASVRLNAKMPCDTSVIVTTIKAYISTYPY